MLITDRSTPAMGSIVINSPQIPTKNPKCGLRIGVDGMVSKLVNSNDFVFDELPPSVHYEKLITNVVPYNL